MTSPPETHYAAMRPERARVIELDRTRRGAYHGGMDETTRTIHLILQLEQALKHMQACRDLSRREPALDDAWRIIDEYRQKLI